MQAVPLFPFVAGYAVGILHEWFGVSLYYSAILGFSFVSLQLQFLLMTFIRKHQAIAIILKTHVLPNYLFLAHYLLCLITPSLITLGINIVHIEKEQKLRYIAEIMAFIPDRIPDDELDLETSSHCNHIKDNYNVMHLRKNS
ncbi:hypothetical protein GCK72_020726 [Caenorhabditis remanei]|uniref:Uncharacterized protein n=1 Tax=Caenorhabditis remanei TaxID=31234 RepID=A0A6A5GHM3_CAERE|nr:hypothetical protein GCK72_020726 [Caenorhabditis remanei]KAF1754166.1 hypothetical protein GCK72_020726 [Caenorhabditis remanei]